MLKNAFEIIELINDAGGEARIVGGAVRDYILNKNIKDVDIASTFEPADLTKILESQNIKVIPTGIDFGTVTAIFKEKPYEITTLRKDINCDGRHAKISYTNDWQEDAARRDFTFNALYMDVNGKIYDYFKGQEDLAKGIVRFIGNANERIKEDYLRILRMFRFFAYYGKENLPKKQLEECKLLSCNLKKISSERIWLELEKILIHPKALLALNKMSKCHVFENIYDLSVDYKKTLNLLENFYLVEKSNSALTSLSILMNVSDGDSILNISKALRLSKKEKKVLEGLSKARLINFQDEYEINRSIRLNGKDEFKEFLYLNHALGRIDKNELDNFSLKNEKFEIKNFPLKGQDLLDYGIVNKRKFGEYLSYAEQYWEKNNYHSTKKELLLKIDEYIS